MITCRLVVSYNDDEKEKKPSLKTLYIHGRERDGFCSFHFLNPPTLLNDRFKNSRELIAEHQRYENNFTQNEFLIYILLLNRKKVAKKLNTDNEKKNSVKQNDLKL